MYEAGINTSSVGDKEKTTKTAHHKHPHPTLKLKGGGFKYEAANYSRYKKRGRAS